MYGRPPPSSAPCVRACTHAVPPPPPVLGGTETVGMLALCGRVLGVFLLLVAHCTCEDVASEAASPAIHAALQQLAPTAQHSRTKAQPFGFDLAGVFVLADDPLQGTLTQLAASHFGYIGNYAMNGCNNNNPPFSCRANQCNFPGSAPVDSEIGDYATLAKWLAAARVAGLYAGVWTAVYGLNGEAEASCIAEVLASLRTDHNATVDFLLVDGEKAFETHQNCTPRPLAAV